MSRCMDPTEPGHFPCFFPNQMVSHGSLKKILLLADQTWCKSMVIWGISRFPQKNVHEVWVSNIVIQRPARIHLTCLQSLNFQYFFFGGGPKISYIRSIYGIFFFWSALPTKKKTVRLFDILVLQHHQPICDGRIAAPRGDSPFQRMVISRFLGPWLEMGRWESIHLAGYICLHFEWFLMVKWWMLNQK